MKFFNHTIAPIISVILFALTSIYGYSCNSVNDSPEAAILKVKGNYSLTVDHVSVYQQYLELAVGQKITSIEEQLIQEEVIAQFETDPFQVISEVRSLEEMLKKIPYNTSQEKNTIRVNILETIQDFDKDGYSNAFVKIAKAYNSIPLID